MIGFGEAATLIGEIAEPLCSEIVPISQTSGLVLAAPVVAKMTAPATDVSAMDGYAIRNADITAVPTTFAVIGESFAGSRFSGSVGAGQAVRIFTGAPIPAGADRVIIQEQVTRNGDTATVDKFIDSGWHVRPAGSDFQTGEELLPTGLKLGPCQLVTAAAADSETVTVWRKPRIVILSTGDELVPPGSASALAGRIPESVSFGIAAMAEKWGGEVIDRIHVVDDLELLEEAAAVAVERADMVVVTGGASVGKRDYAKTMFEPCGLDLIFSKVAIKPGKPAWVGRVGTSTIVGLPGNPTSAMVTSRLFLAPLIAGLAGAGCRSALLWQTAALTEPLAATGDRETFVRARLQDGMVTPFNSRDSGAQKILASTNCLLRCEAGLPAQLEGAPVSILAM